MPPGRSRRVLVFAASMGAGHLRAADELARRLTEHGEDVRVEDLLALPPGGEGERLRRLYGYFLRRAPAVYDLAMRFWARWPAPLELITRSGATPYEEGIARVVADYRPDVVVSTFNLASQCLGRLRRRGELAVPVVTYVTDPGAHPYWIDRGVDRHLVVTPLTAHELAAMGARGVAVTAPLVRPEFRSAQRPTVDARAQLGLPAGERLALVAAGSEAVGHLRHTVGVIAAGGEDVPVVLCGRDDALRARLAGDGRTIALGWVEDMAALMSAVDVLVDNAGGLTCLEALAYGVPVVLYRPLPGHGRFNASTLERAGLARWARDEAGLLAELRRLHAEPAARAAQVGRGQAIMVGDVAAEVLALLP